MAVAEGMSLAQPLKATHIAKTMKLELMIFIGIWKTRGRCILPLSGLFPVYA